MTAAVLTPFYRSRAVELGNRLWRKKVLPVGDVEYKGRTLHFTLNYLKGLAGAFTARAYDQVAVQLADAEDTATDDPAYGHRRHGHRRRARPCPGPEIPRPRHRPDLAHHTVPDHAGGRGPAVEDNHARLHLRHRQQIGRAHV